MKSIVALGMILTAGVIAGCSLLRGPTPTPAVPGVPLEPCLPSGNQDTINAQLQGPGDIAVLCPGALFELTDEVAFSADRQEIYTRGKPIDDTRAILRIVSPTLPSAVTMRDYSGAVLSNVIVDGNRTRLGPMGGEALIYAGGSSNGQVIRSNKITDTRSWSALQLIQGYSETRPCTNALVEGNQIGPAGTSDDMQWADGISFACMNSRVRWNVITDATDGGIVIFGAPGSVIESNWVIAQTRTLLGGINMVDEGGYDGSYAGTIVRNNIIDASGAVIRIGLGMGPRVWGCIQSNEAGHVISGGTVTHNLLRGAHMQYGFAVDGVRAWTVMENTDDADHTGTPSVACRGLLASPPRGFLYNRERSDGTFQAQFEGAQLDLALWAIVSPRPGE
jgi:hypothetical protein